MNRLFRLLWLLLRYRWAPPCPPLGPCRTFLRVWPNDLDVFLHVNNGVYLTLCDLGRVDLMLRSGTIGVAAGRRRVFLIAAETIQLHRPLKLFERFYIDTTVIGWDEKAFFVQHRFGTSVATENQGPREQTVAIAVVEGRVLDRSGGRLSPAELLAQLGVSGDRPELPDWVVRWREDQKVLRDSVRPDKATPAETGAEIGKEPPYIA